MFILCKISRFLYSAGLAWNCLFTSLLGSFFVKYYPQDEFQYCPNPQKDRPWAKTRRMSHKPWESIHGFDLSAFARKIQYNQLGKSHKTVLFHLSAWEKPEQIEINICTDVELRDVIMDVKFKFDKFKGLWCHWGQNSPLPIDFARAPYHSVALPRCLWS